MFHFPAYTPTRPIHSGAGNKTLLLLGSPIRKPSDQSLSDSSPRLIAGHHVLHRPLMPRHPPNAQKNKQQRHTNKTRNTLSQKSYSKMLASTIQFTTNPPTPGSHHPHKAAEHGPGNQGALPQNPDSMPPPHTQGHPPHPTPHTSRKQKHDGRVSYTKHQTNQPHPREQTHETRSAAQPFRKGRPPSRPRPIQQSEHDQNSQEATPTINP